MGTPQQSGVTALCEGHAWAMAIIVLAYGDGQLATVRPLCQGAATLPKWKGDMQEWNGLIRLCCCPAIFKGQPHHMAQLLQGKARKYALNALFPEDRRLKFYVRPEIARPCVSYALIIQDLELSIESIEKAVLMQEKIANLDDLIISALWQQAIMAYARCFTSSESGFSKLEEGQCFRTDSQRVMHKSLLDLRMSHIAHRGLHKRSRSMMLAVLQSDDAGLTFDYSFPTLNEVGHYHKRPKRVLKFLRELMAEVNQALNKKVSKVDKFIWDDIKQRIASCRIEGQ